MAEEAMPVECSGLLIPRPVRLLGVSEDDPRVGILLIRLTPDVPMTLGRIGRAARFLKPRMLIRGVIEHQIRNHPDAALVGRIERNP